MKKWKFSLETVRQLKQRIEEEAAQKHSRALIQLSKAKAALAETENELNATALMQFSNRSSHNAQQLIQFNQYFDLLEKQRKERLELVLRAEKETTLARAALEKAARDREILERLYGRQRAEHQFHVAKQEQKWVDDIAQHLKRGLLNAV
ncbi:MAG: flagellar export protein FliJ [Verrucomicrobia bacterium SCN 57-15]|nr:MAG: flagellar export protein FliJ [Verrucomicrobia bacterium SCN 57-15]